VADREKILNILFSAIDDFNEIRPGEAPISKSKDTILFGSGGVLDSMGLVTFIVTSEQKIAEETGISITLADERAMSLRNSPFRTVGTLADYIHMLMAEQE